MAIKLSVGLQKKVGLPDYGSLGASCHVEFEIERSMLESDLNGFQQKAASVFAACQQAVNDQLARKQSQQSQQTSQAANNGNGHSSQPGNSEVNGHTNGNGQNGQSSVSAATQSQIRAIFAIARRQQIDPQILVKERFHLDRPEDLSIREASSLIDELKRGIMEGRS